MFSFPLTRTPAIALALLALLALPAPLLPPHWLAQGLQKMLGLRWQAAYLISALGLQGVFYLSVGVLAGLAVQREQTLRNRLAQCALLPLGVVVVSLIIRSVKLGHLPVLENLALPIFACVAGVTLGLGILYEHWQRTVAMSAVVAGFALWGLLGKSSTDLSNATQVTLQRLVAQSSAFPAGDARFAAICQTAFAAQSLQGLEIVDQNRAAILALGIVLGHERLARFVGLERQGDLVRQAVALRQGASLRGRQDWARHFSLSAALAMVDHPFISDAGGLFKEQLDALTGGSGFSFGDLAADRAGVRFAEVATRSEASAKAIQARLERGFTVEDVFPEVSDLAEGLTPEQFREKYGGVGSSRYRQQLALIESRLDQCAALSSAR